MVCERAQAEGLTRVRARSPVPVETSSRSQPCAASQGDNESSKNAPTLPSGSNSRKPSFTSIVKLEPPFSPSGWTGLRSWSAFDNWTHEVSGGDGLTEASAQRSLSGKISGGTGSQVCQLRAPFSSATRMCIHTSGIPRAEPQGHGKNRADLTLLSRNREAGGPGTQKLLSTQPRSQEGPCVLGDHRSGGAPSPESPLPVPPPAASRSGTEELSALGAKSLINPETGPIPA